MSNYIIDLRKSVGKQPLIIIWSTVIVFNKNNEILLQHRSDSNDWWLPGWSMESGESLEQTASRELYEETNLICNEFELIKIFSGEEFYYQYPNWDESYNVIALFKAIKVEWDLKINDNESLGLKYFSIDNLPNMEKRANLILKKLYNII